MLYLYTSVLFLFSPLSGLLSFFTLFLFKKKSVIDYHFIILMFSILLGLINYGKFIEDDLITYNDWFSEVDKYSFFEYIFYKSKEPLFFIYNYITYYLFNGDFRLYLFTTTFIAYYGMGLSLLKFHRATKSSNYVFIFSFLALFLFPSLYALSAQVIRQFLAGAIIFCLIIEIAVFKKSRFYLFAMSILMHTTSLLFAPVYIIKRYTSKDSYYYILGLVVATLLIVANNPSIFSAIGISNPFLQYAVDRAQNLEGSHISLDSLGIINYLLFFFVLYSFKVYSKKNKYVSDVFFGISLLLFCFICSMINNTEVAMRFSFYFYFLIPIATYMILTRYNVFSSYPISILISFIYAFCLATWFWYKLEYGAWTYTQLSTLIYSFY